MLSTMQNSSDAGGNQEEERQEMAISNLDYCIMEVKRKNEVSDISMLLLTAIN